MTPRDPASRALGSGRVGFARGGLALAMLLFGAAFAPVRAQPADGKSDVRAAPGVLGSRDEVGEPITITGHVLDLSGAPIERARAWFVPNGRTLVAQGFEPRDVQPICGLPCVVCNQTELTDDVPADALQSGVTASDGTFEFVARALLDLSEPGELPIGRRHGHVAIGAPGRTFAALGVMCADDRIDVGDILLDEAARVTGRLLDDRGSPVGGARVVPVDRTLDGTRLPLDGSPSGAPSPRSFIVVPTLMGATSDADGRFVVEGLWTGDVTLRVDAPGCVRTAVGARVVAGASLDLGDVALTPGTSLSGTIVDVDGVPLAGALVCATSRVIDMRCESCVPDEYPADGDVVLDQISQVRAGRLGRETRTDAGGRFALGGLDGDALDLYVSARGFEPSRSEVVAGRDVLVVLRPEAWLTVDVVDSRDGSTLGDARLSATRWAGPVDSKFDGSEPPVAPSSLDRPLTVLAGDAARARVPSFESADGRFVVAGTGFRGTYLVASAPGHARVRVLAPGTPPGEGSRLVVALQPEARVEGRVVDDLGRPVAGERVRYDSDACLENEFVECLVCASATTDADGHYELVVPPGTSGTLSVGRSGGPGFARRELVVDAGETRRLDLDVRAGATITGVVRALDGRVPRGAVVRLARVLVPPFDASTGDEMSVRVDGEGHFEARDLQPGRWRASFLDDEREVLLAAGESVELAF